jgi:ABC-type lipoprotein export system ATPase subunit
MIAINELKNSSISQLLERYPFLPDFFTNNHIETGNCGNLSLMECLNKTFDEETSEDLGVDVEHLLQQMQQHIENMLAFLGVADDSVDTVTILPGTDKSGSPETFGELTIAKNEIICIVGPTGSGKSRLLADIEWVANRDTPTKRKILINGKDADKKWRFTSSEKLVAQLSQNMNFVMDLSVTEFLQLHAESRMVTNVNETIASILEIANDLAGEQFGADVAITSLSGGQSRALMIADTAILSKSPVVLIDEIENAGIDRKKALDILLSKDKLVLMATHDPTLALMGSKRIVIKNGGIHKVITTTDQEKQILSELEVLDKRYHALRTQLRQGDILK